MSRRAKQAGLGRSTAGALWVRAGRLAAPADGPLCCSGGQCTGARGTAAPGRAAAGAAVRLQRPGQGDRLLFCRRARILNRGGCDTGGAPQGCCLGGASAGGGRHRLEDGAAVGCCGRVCLRMRSLVGGCLVCLAGLVLRSAVDSATLAVPVRLAALVLLLVALVGVLRLVVRLVLRGGGVGWGG